MERDCTRDEPTVLVVEDDPKLRRIYAGWLRDAYAVRTAGDGRRALDELDDDVDVVLLDRQLPGSSGNEVLERLRSRGLDCRVAMVTAADPGVDGWEMAYDDYLVEPVVEAEVRSTVETLLVRADCKAKLDEHFRLATEAKALEGAESDGRYTAIRNRMSELGRDLDRLVGELADHGTLADLMVDIGRRVDETDETADRVRPMLD